MEEEHECRVESVIVCLLMIEYGSPASLVLSFQVFELI